MQLGPRTLLFFMLLLAMPVAAYFLMFKPLDVHLQEVRAATQEKQQQLDALAEKMTKTKDMTDEIQKLREIVAMLENKLPPDKQTEEVYNAVSGLAVKNHMNFKSVRTMPVVNKPAYSSQSIRIMMAGPMKDGFYKFLADVERGSQIKRLMRITDMSIQADDKVPGNVQVDMTLTVYFESGEKVAVAQ